MDDNELIDLYFKRDENAIKDTERLYGSQLRALAARKAPGCTYCVRNCCTKIAGLCLLRAQLLHEIRFAVSRN